MYIDGDMLCKCIYMNYSNFEINSPEYIVNTYVANENSVNSSDDIDY